MNTWEVQCHLGEGEGIIKHNDTQLNCLNIYQFYEINEWVIDF